MPFTARSINRFLRRPHLVSAVVAALAAFVVLSPWMQIARAMLIAFDLGATVLLAMMGILMSRATPDTMYQRAKVLEEGKWTILAMSLCIAAVVLGALSNELHAAKVKSLADIGLASVSILLAWLFVAVMFSQQYSHSFYLKPGQLQFPGTSQPDYWDFAYFAVVVSMCCQTSDVVVSSGGLRRLVMLHSLLAFFFNLIIIAITVNVVAGVL